jgi:hypothetical protein
MPYHIKMGPYRYYQSKGSCGFTKLINKAKKFTVKREAERLAIKLRKNMTFTQASLKHWVEVETVK